MTLLVAQRGVIGYAANARKTFEEEPFRDADSLVFSCLSYIRLVSYAPTKGEKGASVAELRANGEIDALLRLVAYPDEDRALLDAAASSPRFRDVVACVAVEDDDDEARKQFSAVCFRFAPDKFCVAFRGTDSTVTGWHEDFNMSYRFPVPSQLEAANYTDRVAACFGGGMILCGHSKGGNLAVYAAGVCSSETRARIIAVYSLDGPGFFRPLLDERGFRETRSRVRNFVPGASLVGVLMNPNGEQTVVSSTDISIWQHNPFTWQLSGGDFTPCAGLSSGAIFLAETMNNWINMLSMDEREHFAELLFGIMRDSGIKSFADPNVFWERLPQFVISAASRLSPSSMSLLMRLLAKMSVSVVFGGLTTLVSDSAAALNEIN